MIHGSVHAIETPGRAGTAAKSSTAPPLLRPGLSMLGVCGAMLPAAVGALAATGLAQAINILMVLLWAVLVPAALFYRWAGRVLWISSASFIVLVATALPFNSAEFVGSLWASVAMFVMSFPRPR